MAVLALLAFNAIATETLRDPTQPPALLMPDAGGDSVEDTGPVLQSVILHHGHKPIAIIGGERVELGGKYGESKLIRVTENSAVLQGPSGRETLQLTPAVEKTLVKRRAQKQKSGSEQ